MCIPWKKQVVAALLLLCLPLLLIGCGGGGGGGGGEGGATKTVSGVATVAGPIAKAQVAVYRLSLDGTRGALLGTGTTADDGSYAVNIPESVTGPLVVTVTGQAGATYVSGGQSVSFTAADSFSAVVDNFDPAVPIAVTPLTEAAFQKLPLIVEQKAAVSTVTTEVLQSAVVAANTQVGDLFAVTDILAPPAGSANYQAALLVIDQMIVDSKSGGTVTDTSAVMTLINQAVADVAAPSYQTFADVFADAAAQVSTENPGAVAVAVAAVTAQVTGPQSEPAFGDLSAPSAATGLSAVTEALNATQSSVTLSWSAATDNIGVAGYFVYRDGVRVGTTNTTSFIDQPVTSNVTYAYTVVAFDAAGNLAPASVALSVKPNQVSLNVTVNGTLSGDLVAQLDLVAPSAPGGLTAVATALTGTISSVVLSWSASTDNTGVVGYEVFRDGVKVGTVTTMSFTDPSVTSAVTYSYTVKAFDAAGNRSAASAALLVTPNRPSMGVTVNGQVIP